VPDAISLTVSPLFAFRIGWLALDGILAGHSYGITALDLLAACDNFMAAAGRLGITAAAEQELAPIVANYPHAPSLFRGVILRWLDDAVVSRPAPGIGDHWRRR
jgi:hypothetical protein